MAERINGQLLTDAVSTVRQATHVAGTSRRINCNFLDATLSSRRTRYQLQHALVLHVNALHQLVNNG